MPAKTHTVEQTDNGLPVYTTYKVWFHPNEPVRSRTFQYENEAIRTFEEGNGARLDKIVTTVLRSRATTQE